MPEDDEITYIIEKYGVVDVLEAIAAQFGYLIQSGGRRSPRERKKINSAVAIMRGLIRGIRRAN